VIVLPDTSVWVSFLREGAHGRVAALDGLLAGQQVVACRPVVAEILAGARDVQRSELRTLWSSLPRADLGRRPWQHVGELAARLRAGGATVALTDVAIGVAAVAAAAQLWSWDRDFDRVRSGLPELRRCDPA
jgi:predicted nucleic acid-binding protein